MDEKKPFKLPVNTYTIMMTVAKCPVWAEYRKPIEDKNNTAIDITVNYMPVPIKTLKNNIPDGGLNTSLLIYFQPVYSTSESFSSYGKLSNLRTSLRIVNLIKQAIDAVNNKETVNVIPMESHY